MNPRSCDHADSPRPPARETTRLAPSPTGALHLGNARTFLVNWALARRGGWRIVLRVEDLDTPRVKAGAAPAAVETLRWLGLDWDEGPLVQSRDLSPYLQAMRRLAAGALAYPSERSRAQVEEAASAPQEGSGETVFPASLRPELAAREFSFDGAPWRFVTPPGVVEFTDRFAGPQRREPAASIGDFIIWTRQGVPAYQLAVVVDDHRQGVSQVVRADDLLDSAARQLLLYRALGLGPEPAYTHLPLVRGADGRRLAKRHGDTRLETYRARGVSPQRIVALVARWCGMDAPSSLSAPEFAAGFRLDTIPRHDITFRPEDDRWLLEDA